MKASLPDYNLAEKHGITVRELNDIYRDLFLFIKEHIVSLNFTDISEDEFQQMRTSFMLPGLGKLGTDYLRLTYLQNKNKSRKNARNKTKES